MMNARLLLLPTAIQEVRDPVNVEYQMLVVAVMREQSNSSFVAHDDAFSALILGKQIAAVEGYHKPHILDVFGQAPQP